MDINNLLNEKIKQLEQENKELKEKLKNYTAPSRKKKYYDNHKEELIQKNKEYKVKTNYTYVISPEKKKEYARTAYLNKKKKMEEMKNKNNEEMI